MESGTRENSRRDRGKAGSEPRDRHTGSHSLGWAPEGRSRGDGHQPSAGKGLRRKFWGGIKFSPSLAAGTAQVCHELEGINCHLFRSYPGQPGKDGILFKLWQPAIGDYTLRNLNSCVCVCVCVCVCARTRARACAQLYPTVCNPVDCSLPGSYVHGIFQARILEWVAISSS